MRRDRERGSALERLVELTGNRALTGFTAPKLLWLRRHEPDAYARIARVLLPKDYVRLRLTGEWAIDASDASGTLLLDVGRARAGATTCSRRSSSPPRGCRPCSSRQSAPASSEKATDCYTASPSRPAQVTSPPRRVGVGADRPGVALRRPRDVGRRARARCRRTQHDPAGRVHAFCHAVPGAWQAMGVMLSAAGSLQWFHERLAPDVPFDRARRGGGALGARARAASCSCRTSPASGRRMRTPTPVAPSSVWSSATTAERSSARCSRASRSGCATASTCSARSASTRGPRASRAAARESDLWLRDRRVRARRAARADGVGGGLRVSAPRCSAASPGASSPTSTTRWARCVRVTDVVEPDPAWRDAYAELAARYRALYPALRDVGR